MKIIFTCDESNIEMRTDEPVRFPTLLNILMNGIYSNMVHILNTAPEHLKDEVKEDLYGLVNETASELLLRFAPEFEQHPGLTEQAILEAENDLIDKQYQELIKKHPELKGKVTSFKPRPLQ